MPEIMKDRPSYVRFDRRAVEDRTASIANGHYTTKDVDFAIITPHGSADEIEREVSEWFPNLQRDMQANRIPDDWVERYEKAYERWKKGEELPAEGTPIKGWPVLSPSQQQNLIAMNVFTVEDLARLNESGISRIGLGGHGMKLKAEKWLESANDIGKVAERLTALEISQTNLQVQNDAQAKLISDLRTRNEVLEKALEKA